MFVGVVVKITMTEGGKVFFVDVLTRSSGIIAYIIGSTNNQSALYINISAYYFFYLSV